MNVSCVCVCNLVSPCIPEPEADWRISAVFLPGQQVPLVTCCLSDCTGRRMQCLDGQTHTQWAVFFGIDFICHRVSHCIHLCIYPIFSRNLCRVRAFFLFLLTEAAFGLEFDWMCDGWLWQLPLTSALTHKHVRRCRLTGCDMDNSLHRSHQHTHTPVSALGT